MKKVVAALGLMISGILCSCGPELGPRRTGNVTLSFDSFSNIRYTEVRREFESGYSFNEMGFQQNPEWIMYFLPDDSVKIYSPFEKRFLRYPIYFDHDSVFNTAREWFRLKSINRDSITLQLLQVKDKKVVPGISNVYMRFYSEAYLKKIQADARKLKLPDRDDSLFIYRLSRRANAFPDSIDSAFAATTTVSFKSLSPNILVERVMPKRGPFDDFKPSDIYMHPEYNITIRKAYKDFFYEFNALVDGKGNIRFGELLTMVEDKEGRKAVLNGIIKVYLQQLLQVSPGTTLGYPHTSAVKLNVRGQR